MHGKETTKNVMPDMRETVAKRFVLHHMTVTESVSLTLRYATIAKRCPTIECVRAKS